MCMYFTRGINQNGYMLCRQCKKNKDMHPIFIYLYDTTSQCDDIVLLIQEYIKNDLYQTISGKYKHTITLSQGFVKCWGRIHMINVMYQILFKEK